MPSYEVRLAKKAAKSLESLPIRDQERLTRILDALEENPYRSGVEKLSGTSRMYRARAGDYRIVFEIDDEQRIVDVIRVAHRREVYRR